jgi:hypothetical protein
MTTQLSVFIENKPGKIDTVTGILFRAGISLRGMSLASRGDFGVLKLLPDRPEDAFRALTEAGHTVSRRAVVIALIADKPGSLHEMLKALAAHNVNIDDCYGVAIECDKTAAIVLDVEKEPRAEAVLKNAGIRLLDDLARL